MLPLVMTAAIVVEDQIYLRAAPEERAPHPVILWKGDWLEVRGETRGYLHVYDHRHERAGYVVPSRARKYPVEPSSAAALRTIVDFLRDSTGLESTGIAYVALYLRTAPAAEVDASIFDALGTMADRLAKRVSAGGVDPALVEHLEIAKSYGVRFEAFEKNGRMITCYDGEAFRRALAFGGKPEERARAVLALTDPRCTNPALGAVEQRELAEWQVRVLEEVDLALLPPVPANKIRLRRARAWARHGFELARRNGAVQAGAAIEHAMRALAGIEKAELDRADSIAYEEAAVMVAAQRWATAVPAALPPGVTIARKESGETCLQIAPEFERCTYGILWGSSLVASPRGDRMAVSVEPVPGWVELWSIARDGAGWRAQTVVPAPSEPELGYVEHAGWLKDGKRMLIAREVKIEGAVKREFQIVDADTLAVEKRVDISALEKHGSPAWKAGTLALR